jgi:hypothetical protein
MITVSKKISNHFHSTEFRCKCGCGVIKIDENLVNKLESIYTKLNASKCIISSGYRCSKHDKRVGGSGYGQHTKGLAADCIYYDKEGKIIPSKYVICVAYDLGQLKGIAKINDNYSHLDNRSSGTYRGDETVSFNSVWTNPYSYFGVSRSEIEKYTGEEKKSIDEIAKEVIDGKWGNGQDRKTRLTNAGYNYSKVQKRVNELVNPVKYLSNKNYKGTSIVEGLRQIGVDSSFSYRSKLAQINGITNYKGTAEQNTKMLEMLKNGTLKSV